MDDLNSLKCPQYVQFNSESFQESLLRYDDDDLSGGDLELTCMSPVSAASTDDFPVHTRVTRNNASKVKRNITKPKPFHFQTDGRVKNKDALSDCEEINFTAQLRQHKITKPTTSGVTKVEAFKLTESKTKNVEKKYTSLAEQVNAFQKKTPDRYHSSSKKEFQAQQHWSPPKLRPRTPKLTAVNRHRVVYALSREEQEAKELEEMKAFEFRARPINPRVFKPVNIEINLKKNPTKPSQIELKTSQRAAVRPVNIESDNDYKFRARPVPKNILAGPVGLGEKPEVVITKPISPSFASDKRLAKRKLIEEKEDKNDSPLKRAKIEPKKKPKAKPQPKPAKPKRLKPTEVQPFSFDKADTQRFALKEQKIQEELEKENRPFVFKAQMMPSPSACALPSVEKKAATQPKPFNFRLQSRDWKQSLSIQEESSVSFKAQPATVLEKEPFIPVKDSNHFIEIKEFELNTDRRASERLKLKEEKDEKERELEEIMRVRKEAEEKKEREEILKLRQELVHKANPVRQFKPVEIKPSSKPLTEPISPDFETDKRLQKKK